MLLFLIYLIPIFLTGIIILKKIVKIETAQIIFPAGIILGLTIFTFLLNIIAFVIKGPPGIVVAYSLLIALGVLLIFREKQNFKIIFPKGKNLIFWISGLLFWTFFIYWKASTALIGSDVNLYYAIAHSFVKGNFPFLTPWQPDMPLSYHTGAFELLGAFYYLSGLDFRFLHLFFSFLFISSTIQILLWIIREKHSLISFALSNIAVATAFISFGFIYLTWPVLPFNLPQVENIQQLIIWLRSLPTVNQAIEVYGAPINLDSLIYFIFHAFGYAIFFLILIILKGFEKNKSLKIIILLTGIFAALAIVNEGLFIVIVPIAFFILRQNLKHILFFLFFLSIIFFQGGIIPSSINPPVNTQASAVILPSKNAVKEDFIAYHAGQEKSKLLTSEKQWLSLRWFHLGIGSLVALSIIALFLTRKDSHAFIIIRSLFIAGIMSLLAYNFIVPKYLIANGNRFLAAAFLFFSLLLCFTLIHIWGQIKKTLFKIIFLILIALIFIPTIIPPLALLSKTRFGENKLIPKQESSSEAIRWLKNSLDFRERVLFLDKNAPHPSGQVRALVGAGTFAPVFEGNFKAFTIEASPEYIDSAYYLSPNALKKLKINILVIDKISYEVLPDSRKIQLNNENYFEKLFSKDENETIYRIQKEYIEKGGEIEGTLAQMASLLDSGSIYIDNEENFNPPFLRRAIIFSIRDKDIYYFPGSGVYLNVESDINFHEPKSKADYDFLILGKNTNPKDKCICESKLIWTGLRNEVYLWKADR